MKKIILLVGLVVVAGVGGILVFRSLSAEEAPPLTQSSQAAEALQSKIDAIKKVQDQAGRPPSAERVELSEQEMESYVLLSLKEQIPAQLDSFEVQLGSGTVAADTQITFNSNSTGNPLVDAVVGGTHNLFVKGKLSAVHGRGQFDLEEVRVDGIPVPKVLIQTLFDKYVKPKYPDADLKEPFDLPYGIEQLTIVPGKATVAY